MFKLFAKGDYRKTRDFLSSSSTKRHQSKFDKYGQMGVVVLRNATPKDSGKTADSWSYEIEQDGSSVTIAWINSEMADTTPLAILLQYGHGTRNGGYVQGRDYINPAMQTIFDQMAKEIWDELTR